jgi:DNA mismatch endonuclease, patch repair protein
LKSKYGFTTTKQRSVLMSKIRAVNTKPELLLKGEFRKKRYRFRSNDKNLPGTPDFVFIKKKVIIFVDGEFWHGYKWREKKKRIKTNRTYWINKIEGNIKRDKRVSRKLRKEGWKVLRIWEYQIKRNPENVISKVISVLKK